MKSSRQHKRKIFEAPEHLKRCTGNTVKKSIYRDSGGKDTSGSHQLSATKLPQIGVSAPKTTKMLVSDQQIAQHNHSAKIKLQFFPLTESMRLGLEKDGYNPFLELTLSARKKISSVIKHLNSKWGTSAIANGELMLFPFNARVDNLAVCSRWTQDNSDLTAGQVHVAIGSPALFRLRYGWISSFELLSFGVPNLSTPFGACLESEKKKKGCVEFSESRCSQLEGLVVTCEEPTKIEAVDAAADHLGGDAKTEDGPVQKILSWDKFTNLSIGRLLSESSLQEKISMVNTKSETNLGLRTNQLISEISKEGETLLKSKTKDFDGCVHKVTGDPGLQSIQLENEISIGGLLSEASLLGKNRNCDPTSNKKKLGLQTNMEKSAPQSQFTWDDNLTTLSIGGLLSEASLQGKNNGSDSKLNWSKLGSQEAPPISDSFDAFILAHLNSNPLVSKPLLNDSHSSILDAEETCHAFVFGKFSSSRKDPSTPSGGPSSSGCNNYSSAKPFKFPKNIEENGESLPAQDPLQQPKDVSLPRQKGVYDEDSTLGLSGIKWNDSLGPFDLGLPTTRPVLNSGDSVNINEFVR